MAIELSCPPEPLSIAEVLHTLGTPDSTAACDQQPYLVIPGNSGPRWLIPEPPRAAASVLSAWHPYDFSSRMKWFAVRMAARAGVLKYSRSVSSVKLSRQSVLRWFELCGIPSSAGEMVILVGNPSANRKLVTFLLDEARQIAAVLKIGLSAGGGACVLREADVLGKLEQYSWAPKILSVHSEKWAAAQEYVHGSMPDREFRPGYMELLCNLPRSGGCKTLSAVAAEMFGRLSPLKDELDKMVPGLLDRALDRLDFDHSVPTMLVHGDFSPWNIRRNPKVGDVLVDWERADFAGLPAYDLLHFQFNDDLLFGEKAGGYSAIRSRPICAEYFRRMDLDAELLPRVAIAYLLDQLASDCQPEHAAYLLRQLAVILD